MKDPKDIRAFIAIDIDASVRSHITDLCERLRKGIQFTGANARWISPDAIHLTLHFLGNISSAQVEDIRKAMIRVAQRVRPVTYSIRGLGVFPNEQRPRVLWVGLKRGEEEIMDIHRGLMRELRPLGFKPDDKTFKPHLTLARFKSNRGAKPMLRIIKDNARRFCGESTANGLKLYRSILKPDGARYSVLAEAPFASAVAKGSTIHSLAESPDKTR